MKELLRYKKNLNLAFFDFETECLNLYLPYNLIWEVGLLTTKNGEIKEENLIHVNGWYRELEVSPEAARITGFNQATYLKNAQLESSVFEKLFDTFTKSDHIIGHNIINFDFCLFRHWCSMHGKNWRPLIKKIIDTKALASAIKAEIPYDVENYDFVTWQMALANHRQKGVKTNLSVMADHYGIEYDKSMLHNGLYDIQLNKKVFDKMIWDLEI